MDEGDPAPFVVKLSAQSVLPVRVPVATMDGTAVAGSDYTAIDRTLTFQPGTDSLTVDVSTRDGTDFVFDGTASEPYGEDDAPNPQSVYAASKLLGEWFAQGARHYVLRVESLFGGGEAPAPGAAGRRPGGSLDRIADALLEIIGMKSPWPWMPLLMTMPPSPMPTAAPAPMASHSG